MGGTGSSYHEPVLATESVAMLVRGSGLYLDGTLGGGGHSLAILCELERSGWLEGSLLLGIDQDDEALQEAGVRLADYREHAVAIKGNFRNIAALTQREAASRGMEPKAAGILLDLGVSSHQLDVPVRGFSYMQPGPLDMRMDSGMEDTAADILNSAPEAELASIFFRYGEEPRSRAIARAVVARRVEGGPLQTTDELADAVRSVVFGRERVMKALSRVFQALRIAVNRELEVLERVLADGAELLRPGGRMAVISYHSLEDRMVKRFFSSLTTADWGPKGVGLREPLRPAAAIAVTKKPVRAGAEEVARNPRARSAKLRVIETMGGGK